MNALQAHMNEAHSIEIIQKFIDETTLMLENH